MRESERERLYVEAEKIGLGAPAPETLRWIRSLPPEERALVEGLLAAFPGAQFEREEKQ